MLSMHAANICSCCAALQAWLSNKPCCSCPYQSGTHWVTMSRPCSSLLRTAAAQAAACCRAQCSRTLKSMPLSKPRRAASTFWPFLGFGPLWAFFGTLSQEWSCFAGPALEAACVDAAAAAACPFSNSVLRLQGAASQNMHDPSSKSEQRALASRQGRSWPMCSMRRRASVKHASWSAQ